MANLVSVPADGSQWSDWGRSIHQSVADLQSVEANVKDYNAKGDGVTSDQTAIVNAVADALAKNISVYWPEGTYLTTASIPDFHRVDHKGTGIVKRGTSLFYVNPVAGVENRIYVAVTGASDNNDGLSASQPFRTFTNAVKILSNYGPSLVGSWRFTGGAGTYSERIIIPAGLESSEDVVIEGPSVTHPTVPTCIVSQGYNIGAVGLKLSDASVQLRVRNIHFIGYNGTTSSSGVTCSSNLKEVAYENVHTTDCYWGLSNQSTHYDVKGGVHIRDGFLGDTPNNTAPASRNGNGGAFRSLMLTRHSIGLQNAGVLTNGPIVKNCLNGLFAQESCTGHVDYVTFEDNESALSLNVNSRANCDGSSFKRNNKDIRANGNSHVFISANTSFGAGVDESDIKVSLLSGSTLVDSSVLFTSESPAYGSDLRNLNNTFPNQTINSISATAFYTTTLKANMWRDVFTTLSPGKKISFKVYGDLIGTTNTKRINFRVGTSVVSLVFTATDVGTFRAQGVVFFTDRGTQFLDIEGARHLGTNVRGASIAGTNPMSVDTNLSLEAQVGDALDSVKINAVEVNWAG